MKTSHDNTTMPSEREVKLVLAQSGRSNELGD